MVEIKASYANSGSGQVQIVDEVIAVIAGTATMEIEGVSFMSGHHISDFSEILGKKNLSKGVKVNTKDNEVEVTLNIYVKHGYKVHEVSKNVQSRVKTAIETMTGITNLMINVNVTGISIEKEKNDMYKDMNEAQLD